MAGIPTSKTAPSRRRVKSLQQATFLVLRFVGFARECVDDTLYTESEQYAANERYNIEIRPAIRPVKSGETTHAAADC